MICVRCASALGPGRFCPLCGAEQPAARAPDDALVGALIADRYEVGSLLGQGGMGRVYEATHRALDRKVAIKFIDAAGLAGGDGGARFMLEARTASRLSHPNVVSIYDFGRTGTEHGRQLYLVMELLHGRSLAETLASGDAIPLARIARIVTQVLAGLGEAHSLDITHRDVKPDNILLEPTRREGLRAKVIDFGLAQFGNDERLTIRGQVVGTPQYVSPEQAMGQTVSAASDLYSTAVVLFEMLTGRAPFVDPDPRALIMKHVAAPRPDPRQIAPDRAIPDAVAEVCMRGMAVAPGDRFESAEYFAEALVRATTDRAWTSRDASIFPRPLAGPRPSRPVSIPSPATGVRVVPAEAPTSEMPELILGRDASLAWAREILARVPAGSGAVICGRAGVGRSAFLRALVQAARTTGCATELVAAPALPRCEESYGAARSWLTALAREDVGDERHRHARSTESGDGLRIAFDGAATAGHAREAIEAVTDSLAWAARRAIERAPGGRVLLAIDDVDRIDGASLAVLGQLLRADPITGFSVWMTSATAPEDGEYGHLPCHRLEGLSAADASALARIRGAKAIERDDVEPLFVELWAGLAADAAHWASASLPTLIEERLRSLPPAAQRLLQAIAVMGGGRRDEVRVLLSRGVEVGEEFDEALAHLTVGRWVQVERERVSLRHESFGEIALALASSGLIADLHAAAAEALAETPGQVERRGYHAIRAEAGFEAYLLVEETARLRLSRADQAGAIDALSAGAHAARTRHLRDDDDTSLDACVLFTRKLADVLVDAGRADEAYGVLAEISSLTGPRDPRRAHVLDGLATVALLRGRVAEAQRHRREAIEIALQTGDDALAQRLAESSSERKSGTHVRLPFLRRSSAPRMLGASRRGE